jgi:hypothetical protein
MSRSALGAPLIGGVIPVIIGMVGVAAPYITTQQIKGVAAIGGLPDNTQPQVRCGSSITTLWAGWEAGSSVICR